MSATRDSAAIDPPPESTNATTTENGMDRTRQAEQRVRKLLELAHLIAADYFKTPSDELVFGVFHQLSMELGSTNLRAPGAGVVGTVH